MLICIGCVFLTTCKDDEEGSSDLDFTLEGTMDCVVPPARGPVEFSGFCDIDPTAYSDFMEHFDNFEDVQITSLNAEVLDVSMPDVTINWITFKIYHSTDEALWSFTDIPLSAGTTFTLDNGEGQWDIIKKIVKKKVIFFVLVEGESSQGNIHFTLIIENGIKLTGQV